MSQESSHSHELSRAAEEAIRGEVDRLAGPYGLDGGRVRGCLERLVHEFGRDSISDAEELGFAFRYGSLSILSEALMSLNPQDALALIEREDVRSLSRRAWATRYLARDRVPLDSLEDLADRTEQFIAFLEEDRDHLIGTGLPSQVFRSSTWLDYELARLYLHFPRNQRALPPPRRASSLSIGRPSPHARWL